MKKSTLMFSPNNEEMVKDTIKNFLNIMRENWNEKYLGLPVHVGRSRRKAFGYIKKNIYGRVYGW